MANIRGGKIVIITPEQYITGEERVIEHITSSGGIIHIRKPHSTLEELTNFAERIASKGDKSNLSIHYNVEIAKKAGLGGCHIRFSDFKEYKSENLRLSCSTHSLKEAFEAEKSSIAYYFLSPIFDSISKVGYQSSFELDELSQLLNEENRCVALGGVSEKNIDLLSKFYSAALIGAIWIKDGDKIDVKRSIDQYEEIKKRWQELKKYNI